ncbi:hypothetical protein WS62_23360 [Burkholderia sp. ABCPW 14]|uniref:hypothetical protein n=1 Tax=Burkholderia sp. ABCPW 14 TaxID=1637860 RepID=UPI000770C813|nr:hypothetical protein [Burkholderia sp. ABCPW 14]KVD81898.1 hypothetical protein WS62_23360 [Burkholderia sp. ABCPW 14]
MKFNIYPVHGDKYSEVLIEIDNVKVELGWLNPRDRNKLAETLRKAADELCPDDVPYEVLRESWEMERDRENAR